MVEQDYKKRKESVTYARLLGGNCLEVYCDARERWLLAWNQNKHIIN